MIKILCDVCGEEVDDKDTRPNLGQWGTNKQKKTKNPKKQNSKSKKFKLRVVLEADEDFEHICRDCGIEITKDILRDMI